jgi:hypothetical protein
VRRHLPLITVFACQALLAALALFLFAVVRPQFAEAFAGLEGSFPRHTRLVLTSWFLPSLPIFAVACDAVALLLPKRSTRNSLFGIGLIVPAFGLALAIDAIFVPLFQSAPAS